MADPLENLKSSTSLLQVNAIFITGFIILISFTDSIKSDLSQSLFISLIGIIIFVFSISSMIHIRIIHGGIEIDTPEKAKEVRKILKNTSIIGFIMMSGISLIIVFNANCHIEMFQSLYFCK